ncbi:MAG TPA: 4Fe-4S binding protein [Bacteroidales bacterium]|nr:4Fe-4S binding protein [Bacteroidales bacterium]HRZ76096.1 4Fe-4S binding protein [Bacteroidales bacterium]
MNGRKLRRWRVFSALAVLLVFALWFLDLAQAFPIGVFTVLRYIQLVPALQLALSFSLGGVAALLLLLLSALVFGRAYCSFLCPLGLLQDLMSRIRAWIRPRKRYPRQKAYRMLRYGMLLVFLVSLAAGSGVVTGLLDPYSWFGRIAFHLVRPPLTLLHNLAAWGMNSLGSFALNPVKFHGMAWAASGAAAAMLALLGVMVWNQGRQYCNTICPVGTLLGLAGCKALLRVHFEKRACTACGLCAAACKAGCIDVKHKTVDHERCVVCFNCLPSCAEGGIRYGRPQPATTDLTRRDLLVRAGSTVLLPAVLKDPGEKARAKAVRLAPIAPPGALSHPHLWERCTACHLCISACPTGVLQPSLLEYGLGGLFQPVMDPLTGYCNYECTRCTEVCPTGALQPLSADEKKQVQIGRTRFIEELCVVTKDNTACGACSEHCPTKAVNMIPWKGTLNIPNVDNSICVGCGACEYACPTTPRSIVVDGNPIHRVAERPKEIGEKAEEVEMEEFPF